MQINVDRGLVLSLPKIRQYNMHGATQDALLTSLSLVSILNTYLEIVKRERYSLKT